MYGSPFDLSEEPGSTFVLSKSKRIRPCTKRRGRSRRRPGKFLTDPSNRIHLIYLTSHKISFSDPGARSRHRLNHLSLKIVRWRALAPILPLALVQGLRRPNCPENGWDFGSNFATRLLPKFRPTVAERGREWRPELRFRI